MLSYIYDASTVKDDNDGQIRSGNCNLKRKKACNIVNIFIKTDDGKLKIRRNFREYKTYFILYFLILQVLFKNTLPVFRPDSDINSRFQHIHSITHTAKVAGFGQ
jgi:hypothetical protein